MLERYSSLDVILSHAKGGTKNPFEVAQILRSLRSLRMTKVRLTKLLFFIPLLFLGCYPSARLKPPPEELTPERVLERAISNQELVNSSASLISFNFKSSQENFSGDLELFFRKPDNFAFAVKALLGPDFVSGSISADSLLLFFPRSKQYYKGRSINCIKGVESQTEFDLFCLLRLLVSETKINQEKAHFTGMDKENYVYEDSIETWKRSFWVNKEGAFLTKSIWEPIFSTGIKAGESNEFVIEYKNFEKFNQTKLPRAIEIKSLDEKVKLKLKFLERNINISIPNKKFQIKIPEDAKPVEIDKSG
ncbi:MAG: hypothetical protein A2W07_01845 [candidate division Zixibacteria bacterium RBG_16_43_9]|nr:MAG: hypothetical protein A2W07_01845 [candidate division Zixibacteria bacterium RBG_16_43_9]